MVSRKIYLVMSKSDREEYHFGFGNQDIENRILDLTIVVSAFFSFVLVLNEYYLLGFSSLTIGFLSLALKIINYFKEKNWLKEKKYK